jgi:ABC-type nitrate/sulfonate/bicarbonate transport system permease component
MTLRNLGFERFILIVAFLLLWQIFSVYFPVSKLIPPPMTVGIRFYEMVVSLELFTHILVSLRRIIIGYLIGASMGVVAGCVIGRIKIIRDLLELPLSLLRSINPLSLIPLAILWFGIGETSKHFLIIYMSFIVVTFNSMGGVVAVPEIQVRIAKCLGATETRILMSVILPSAFPYIFTGLRLALGFSVMTVVGAEMIGANSGLGFLIMHSRFFLLVDKIFVGLVTLGLLGIAIDQVFVNVASRFLPHLIRQD